MSILPLERARVKTCSADDADVAQTGSDLRAALKRSLPADDITDVPRFIRLRRPLLLSLAIVATAWTIGGPLVGSVLYRTPEQQPRGAAKLIFFCHLS